jgi:hypothetical protein
MEQQMLYASIQVAISALLLLSPYTGFAMESSVNQLHPAIFANECDEDLELEESSNLETSLAEFSAKGGTLIRLEGMTSPFQFAAGDMVFPACSGANNRSQTLWNLLRIYEGAITVQLPHATRYGFDPYNGQANWNRTIHVQKDDEFINWAGVSKSAKFGWALFNDWLLREETTESELATMTAYYNTHYYNPPHHAGTRRIYITFAKNAHVHLHRLNQTNTTLENVFVLFFPLEDLIAHPLPEWETKPQSLKAYRELAALIEKYLDFSQLTSRSTNKS